eukprot:TRINITY_DN12386_c0_g1_i2.p1 TRINITY_DN12386_c0_g1~~TRINITY_DN12386_c0_g1_i2.p1  ORF type:complete len:294 (+),score=93.11 TRINITY_DN12386_c0_g1_i2:65-946(+)
MCIRDSLFDARKNLVALRVLFDQAEVLCTKASLECSSKLDYIYQFFTEASTSSDLSSLKTSLVDLSDSLGVYMQLCASEEPAQESFNKLQSEHFLELLRDVDNLSDKSTLTSLLRVFAEKFPRWSRESYDSTLECRVKFEFITKKIEELKSNVEDETEKFRSNYKSAVEAFESFMLECFDPCEECDFSGNQRVQFVERGKRLVMLFRERFCENDALENVKDAGIVVKQNFEEVILLSEPRESAAVDCPQRLANALREAEEIGRVASLDERNNECEGGDSGFIPMEAYWSECLA